MRIAIDGYNLIAAIAGSSLNLLDLEAERESLIGMLADYRSCRRHVVEVVFDGWQVAGGGVRSGQQQGIKIVFSPLGMKADLVLLRLAEKYGSGLTVVTDDGELRHKVQRHHAVTIGSLEFYDQMMTALMAKEKGLTGEDEDLDDRRQTKSTKKKGNPRRLSRKERRKAKRIKSL